MPDPVSKAEIEDVLTSIRRLVSENRPVSEAPVPEETGAEEAERASDGPVQNASMALVLTPALRVEEDPEEFSEGADAPLDISAYESDDEAVFDAEDSTEEAEVEAESFLDEEVELPQAVFHHRPLDEEVTSPEVPFEVGDDAIEPAVTEDVLDEEVTDDVHNLEGWDEATSEEFVEDHGLEAEDEETALSDAEVSKAEDPHAEAGFVEVDDSEDEETTDEPFDFKKVLEARLVHWRDGDGSAAVEDEPVDSDYAEAVAFQPETAEDVEKDLEDEDALQSEAADIEVLESPLEALGQIAQAQMATEVVDGVGEAVEAGLSDALDEPALIDEEALREMVADIVRQELQGALGERITRNVRKLVRREIHRALAAHDLD